MCLWLYNELKKVRFNNSVEKAVMLALAYMADENQEAWPAIRSKEPGSTDLELLTSFKKRAIGNAIKRLEQAGWLIVKRIKGIGNRYFINSPASRALQLKINSVRNAPAGAPDALNPQKFERRKADQQLSNGRCQCPVTGRALPDEIGLEQWNAYREVRKQKSLPCTEYVLTKLIAKLFEIGSHGGCPEASLDAVINNGWADIHPKKLASKFPAKTSPVPKASDTDRRIGEAVQISELIGKYAGKTSKTVQ